MPPLPIPVPLLHKHKCTPCQESQQCLAEPSLSAHVSVWCERTVRHSVGRLCYPYAQSIFHIQGIIMSHSAAVVVSLQRDCCHCFPMFPKATLDVFLANKRHPGLTRTQWSFFSIKTVNAEKKLLLFFLTSRPIFPNFHTLNKRIIPIMMVVRNERHITSKAMGD